jgi:ATP-binding cassette subfamily F protein uup
METLDLLQEVVAGFPGTVILVSHDRDFLDRTVTSTLVPEGDGRWTEYAGGYADMVAQRGAPLGTRSPVEALPREAGQAAAPKREPAPARKLSYKQKFALETLPGRISAAEKEIAALEGKMADPEFYRRDAAAFSRTATMLDEKRTGLAAMEEEWLELEMLREEIEG